MPLSNQFGSATITLTAADPLCGTTSSTSFLLTVLQVNDAPAISIDTNSIPRINEDTISLFSVASTDFYMEDFAKPVNQDAMVGMLKWYGNLMVMAPQLSGKMTAVTA